MKRVPNDLLLVRSFILYPSRCCHLNFLSLEATITQIVRVWQHSRLPWLFSNECSQTQDMSPLASLHFSSLKIPPLSSWKAGEQHMAGTARGCEFSSGIKGSLRWLDRCPSRGECPLTSKSLQAFSGTFFTLTEDNQNDRKSGEELLCLSGIFISKCPSIAPLLV